MYHYHSYPFDHFKRNLNVTLVSYHLIKCCFCVQLKMTSPIKLSTTTIIISYNYSIISLLLLFHLP